MTPGELFWPAHTGLPREAPGSAATLHTLLGLAGPLPESDRDACYGPLAARVARLRREHPDAAALDGIEEEITMRREHRTDYGYAAYVLKPG